MEPGAPLPPADSGTAVTAANLQQHHYHLNTDYNPLQPPAWDPPPCMLEPPSDFEKSLFAGTDPVDFGFGEQASLGLGEPPHNYGPGSHDNTEVDRACGDIDALLAGLHKERNQAALASSAAALELAEANTAGQAAAAARELTNLKRVAHELHTENTLLKRRAAASSGTQLSTNSSQLQRLQAEEQANNLRITALNNEISKLNSHNRALKQIEIDRGGSRVSTEPAFVPHPAAAPPPSADTKASKPDNSEPPDFDEQRRTWREADSVIEKNRTGSKPMPPAPSAGQVPSPEYLQWLSDATKPAELNVHSICPYYGKLIKADSQLSPEIPRPLGLVNWYDPIDPQHFNLRDSMTAMEQYALKQGTPTLSIATAGITFTTKKPPVIGDIDTLLSCSLKLGTYMLASNRWNQAEALKHGEYVERLRAMSQTFSFQELLKFDSHMRVSRHLAGDGAWDTTDEKANLKFLQVPMAERITAAMHQARSNITRRRNGGGSGSSSQPPQNRQQFSGKGGGNSNNNKNKGKQSDGGKKKKKRLTANDGPFFISPSATEGGTDGARKSVRSRNGNMTLARPAQRFTNFAGKPICTNWNWRKCNDPSCTRAHICSFCKGEHKVAECAAFKTAHPADFEAGR